MSVAKIKRNYDKLISSYKAMKEAETRATIAKSNYEEEKSKMLENMEYAGTATYKGDNGTISLTETVVPTVQDWGQFNKFVLKNAAFDLYQRRVSSTAWRDRLEAGEKIPGVLEYTRQNLRVTQSK
tara:strand:+ start:5841 stop:6218 length:378 start_codon:yes stop_codon:yes gene_type:complete